MTNEKFQRLRIGSQVRLVLDQGTINSYIGSGYMAGDVLTVHNIQNITSSNITAYAPGKPQINIQPTWLQDELVGAIKFGKAYIDEIFRNGGNASIKQEINLRIDNCTRSMNQARAGVDVAANIRAAEESIRAVKLLQRSIRK